MTRYWTILGWAGAVAVLLVTCVGCPDGGAPAAPSARLQGTVTLNGGAIPTDARATITFESQDNVSASSVSSLIEDGKFDVPKVPLGKARARISIHQPTGKMIADPEGRGESEEIKDLVPESWRSGQEVEVTGDKSDLNFELK